MGGHTEWRNFFYNLFGECFSESLNTFDSRFHYCIIDFTQFLYASLRSSTQNGKLDTTKLIHSLTTTVENYMNNDDNPQAPIISVGTIVLLDSILHVPKNKVETQKSRDKQAASVVEVNNNNANKWNVQSEPRRKNTYNVSPIKNEFPVKRQEEEDENEQEEQDDNDQNERDQDECIMDEETFNQLLQHFNIEDYDESLYHIFIHEDDNQSLPLGDDTVSSSMIWRSHNLKWQLYRLVTHELLSLNIKVNRVMILDEGIGVANSRFEEIRKEMMGHHNIDHQYSPFAKEVFLSNMTLHHIFERFVLYSDDKIARLPINKIGEADIKIAQYITPDNIVAGVTRYLVISQDTDVIFILLAHLKRLLKPPNPSLSIDTQMKESPLEIWIDTQTPADKASSSPISRPYRFINIKRLYYCLHDLFRKEYSKVENPIELLIFLVNSMKTDFTAPFASHLRITPLTVWDAFSELHYTPMVKVSKDGALCTQKSTASTASQQGYIQFNGKLNSPIKRSNTAHFSSKFRHILGTAIHQCQFDRKTKTYNFTINYNQIEMFFYQLCQVKVVKDLGEIGLSQFQSSDILGTSTSYRPQASISLDTIEEIFYHVNEILTRIDEYKKTNTHESHYDIFIQKKKKPRLNANFKATLDIIEQENGKSSSSSSSPSLNVKKNNGIAALNNKQLAYLKKLSEMKIPRNYGIPTHEEMKRRVYNTEWIVRYYQNGSICPKFGYDYDEYHSTNPGLSIWGWKSIEVRNPTLKQLNSSYYLHIITEVDDNKMVMTNPFPFRLFTVKKADHVFNRSLK